MLPRIVTLDYLRNEKEGLYIDTKYPSDYEANKFIKDNRGRLLWKIY